MFKFSSEDIANQTFERSFRGYDPEQVEEFLRVVAREWEHLRSELERARREASDQSDELEEYREREERLQDALEMAKRVSDEIKEEAERKAELKIADAEVEADRIVASVEEEVQDLQEDIYQLKQQRRRYAAELRALLNSHLEMLERMEEEPSYDEGIPRAPQPVSVEEATSEESGNTDTDNDDAASSDASDASQEEAESGEAQAASEMQSNTRH